MKKLSLIVVLVLMSVGVFAQASEAYKKGQIDLSAGIGLASVLGGTPIYVAGEWGWNEQWGFGGGLSRQTYSSGYYDVSWNLISINAIYHQDYFKMANLDTYGRFGLGYAIVSFDYTGPAGFKAFYGEPSVSAFGYDAAIGAHYYFMPNLGVNAELGYGLALFKVGITYKM